MVDDTNADNLGDQLQQAVDTVVDDSTRLHNIIHGTANPGTVAVEGGSVRTVSKLQADIETAATGQRNAIGQEAVTQRQGIDTAATSQRTAIDNAATALAGNILEASELQIGILQQWDFLSDWNDATAYAKYNVVSHPNGNAYIALKPGANRNPETATTFWHKIVSKGDPGDGRPVDADVREGGVLYEGLKDAIEALWFNADDFAIEQSCQVQGADTTPINSSVGMVVSLTCIGTAPASGTGLLDGVITLNSDTNFTWDGVAFSDSTSTPENLIATRMPNDGANDAMVQHWIVKGAVFDFRKTGVIIVNNAIGFTNATGSFEGVVVVVPEGKAVTYIEAIVTKLIAETPGSGISEYDAEAEYDYPSVVAHAGRIWIKKQGTANTAGQAPSETSTVWDGQAKLSDIPDELMLTWDATTTYNTGDVVVHPTGVYQAIADNVTSATFEPSVGAAWQSGFVLRANATPGIQGIQGKGYRALTDPWTSGTTYTVNDAGYDVVFDADEGGAFVCKQTHVASASNKPPNVDYWIRQSSKGADGTNTNTGTDVTSAVLKDGGVLKEQDDINTRAIIATDVSPALLQEVHATVEGQNPGKSYRVTAEAPELATDVLTIPTAGLTGVADGRVFKVEFDFYPNANYGGFAPTFKLALAQGEQALKNYDPDLGTGLEPQQPNRISFFARKGPPITLTGVANVGRGSDATFTPRFTPPSFIFKGEWHDTAVTLINSQIAIALLEKQTQITANARELVSQGMSIESIQSSLQTLRDAYNATVAQYDTPSFNFLRQATVSEAKDGVTQAKTALGTTWGATIGATSPPYSPRIAIDMVSGTLRYGVGKADDNVLIYLNDNGGMYGRRRVALQPARTVTDSYLTTHANHVGQITAANPYSISLGTNNNHLESTHSLTPEHPIPAGTTVSVDAHAFVNDSNRQFVEIDYVWGSNTPGTHIVENEGNEVVTLTVDEFNGEIRLRVTETGDNNLAIDDGQLLVWAHYDIVTEHAEIPATTEDVWLFTPREHNIIALTDAGAGNSNTVMIHYGEGQVFDTGNPGSTLLDYFVNQSGDAVLGDTFFEIGEQTTYDVSVLEANALAGIKYWGLFIDEVHHSQLFGVPGGVTFVKTTGDTANLEDELAKVAGTDIITFSDNAETVGAHPEFGGGVRFETVVLDLTGSEIANGGKSITVPPGTNIVFMGYSAEVIKANSTAATVTVRGGKPIPNTGEDGSYTIALGEAGATIAHAFGIARNDKTSTITLSGATGTIDATAVLRLSIRIYQTVPTGVMPSQRTANTNAGESGGGDAPNGIQYARKTLTGANEIKNGQFPIDELFNDASDDENLAMIVGLGVDVKVACASTDSIGFGVGGGATGATISLDVSLEQKKRKFVADAGSTSLARWLTITGVDATVSSTCQVEVVFAYIPLNPFTT